MTLSGFADPRNPPLDETLAGWDWSRVGCNWHPGLCNLSSFSWNLEGLQGNIKSCQRFLHFLEKLNCLLMGFGFRVYFDNWAFPRNVRKRHGSWQVHFVPVMNACASLWALEEGRQAGRLTNKITSKWLWGWSVCGGVVGFTCIPNVWACSILS